MSVENTEGSTCAPEVTDGSKDKEMEEGFKGSCLDSTQPGFLNKMRTTYPSTEGTRVSLFCQSTKDRVGRTEQVVGLARFSVHILMGSQRRTYGLHKNRDIIWRVSDYPVPPTAFLHTIIRIPTTIFCIHKSCRRLLQEITGLHTSARCFRSSIWISKTGLNTKWPKTNLRHWTHRRTHNVQCKPPKLMWRNPHIVRSKGG
jgi:hypothetical protein